MSRLFVLIPVLFAAATLAGCNVGPERATGRGYADTDSPMNVIEWTAGDDLTITGQGDPSALRVDAGGITLGTEGIGTALGISPDGSLFAWSPKDVEIGSLEFEADPDGGIRPARIEGLRSTASTVRQARAELAEITAAQIVQLADAERAAAVEALRVLESAGIPLAAEALRLIVGVP